MYAAPQETSLVPRLRSLPRHRRDLQDGFLVGFGNQPANCREFSTTHTHELAYFSLLFHGHCEERVGASARTMPAWVLSYHPSEESHARATGPSGYGVFGIQLTKEALERTGSKLEATDLIGDPFLARRFACEYLEKDDASGLALTGLIYEMLAQAVRNGTRPETSFPKWLTRARDLLHNGCWSLSKLADEVSVSPSHLAREFRSHFGCSVGEYCRVLRLSQAGRRLTSSDSTVSSIATEFGFADESHFTRLFKRHYGVTPSNYRLSPRTPP